MENYKRLFFVKIIYFFFYLEYFLLKISDEDSLLIHGILFEHLLLFFPKIFRTQSLGYLFYFFFLNSFFIIFLHFFLNFFILIKIISQNPKENYFEFKETHIFFSGIKVMYVFPAIISSETINFYQKLFKKSDYCLWITTACAEKNVCSFN